LTISPHKPHQSSGQPHRHHHHHHQCTTAEEEAAEASILAKIQTKDIVKIIEDGALDTGAISREVTDDKAGGIALFVGTTRDHHNGKTVLKLEYEAYIPMAEKELRKIVAEMRQKWQVRA